MFSSVHGCGWYTATDVRTFPFLEHVLPTIFRPKTREIIFIFISMNCLVQMNILPFLMLWRKYRTNPDTDVTRIIVTSSSHHDTGSG